MMRMGLNFARSSLLGYPIVYLTLKVMDQWKRDDKRRMLSSCIVLFR